MTRRKGSYKERGRRRYELIKKLDKYCKTVKIFPEEDGKYLKWLTPDLAARLINEMAKSGFPYKVYDVYLENKPSTHPYWGYLHIEKKFLGYYLRAEITDAGELWVRFFETKETKLQIPMQERPRYGICGKCARIDVLVSKLCDACQYEKETGFRPAVGRV